MIALRKMAIQYRPTIAEIDLNALRHNVAVVRSLIPDQSQIVGIIKADAYGHGAVMVARTLNSCGIKKMAVATVEEGSTLREQGLRSEIMVLGGLFGLNSSLFREYSLNPVLHNNEDFKAVIAQLKDRDQNLKVHIKFDTGMGRLGFNKSELPEMIKKVRYSNGLQVESVMTHLANADGCNPQQSEQQIRDLDEIFSAFREAGVKVEKHFANSAAISDGFVSVPQWVRPGIMLYGSYPADRFKNKIDLKPVMRFKTRLLDVKSMPQGQGISYGHTFVTKRDSLIGVLPVGYADGYSRHLTNKGFVFLKGMKVPVVGRVCMDLTLIDVTDVVDVKIGDEVELWGENISVDEVAMQAQTISYELLCGVSKRVPRVYLNL
ncbi:MAG: hypothetical protein ACD_73C00695G0003 [uncultured bacterium]|nr:MAG: hypothetical protein ACD_73C00695G0003 [uncultured bacterium]